MPWLLALALALGFLACNRTPAGDPAAADKRPPSTSAPADWARRNGYDTGAPPLDRRDDAGQPAASTRGVPQRQ
jgi:hypothetical protein